MAPRTVSIWGKHAVRLALERSPEDVLELWFREDGSTRELADIAAAARALGIATHATAPRTLDRISGGAVHQGIVARRKLPRPLELDVLLAALGGAVAPPVLLVLDQIQDPHNLGACLRAADGAGARAVVIPRDRAAALSDAVAKVASGAIDTVAVVEVANLVRALEQLKEAGFWVVGTSHDAATAVWDCDLKGPVALVFGGERRGLRRLTREGCDILVRIPMQGALDSLNIASAAAVCLFEAVRQRAAGS